MASKVTTWVMPGDAANEVGLAVEAIATIALISAPLPGIDLPWPYIHVGRCFDGTLRVCVEDCQRVEPLVDEIKTAWLAWLAGPEISNEELAEWEAELRAEGSISENLTDTELAEAEDIWMADVCAEAERYRRLMRQIMEGRADDTPTC